MMRVLTMLQIKGQVINVFTVSGGKDKDGNDYEPRNKVQLMGQVALQNGDSKFDLMDLTIDDLAEWKDLKTKHISVDVGAFAPSKGNIVFFVPKGVKPRLI